MVSAHCHAEQMLLVYSPYLITMIAKPIPYDGILRYITNYRLLVVGANLDEEIFFL